MKLMIHSKGFSRKPEGSEIGMIQNSIMSGGCEVDKASFAQVILQGQTVIPAYIEGKGTSKDAKFISQQIWMFDIDNDNASLTVDKVVDKCRKLELAPFLIYETFSSTKDVKRYRVCFTTTKEVTDLTVRDRIVAGIIRALSDGIMEADERCINVGRLFFGGKGILYKDLKADNTIERMIDVASLYPTKVVTKKVRTVKEGFKGERYTTPEVEMIRLGQVVTLRRTLGEVLSKQISIYNIQLLNCTLKTPQSPQGQLLSTFDRLPMHLILGLPIDETFRCILHDDSTPSANITELEDGRFRYKCFGCMEERHALSLVGVIEAIRGKGKYDAIRFLKELFNIRESEWVMERKSELDMYKEFIENPRCGLRETNPALYAELDSANALSHLMFYLDMARSFIVDRTDSGVDEIIFFLSMREAEDRLRTRVKYGCSLTAVAKKLNFLVRLGLIRKLHDSEIPANLLRTANKIKADNKSKYRKTFYSIPTFSQELFDEAERILKEEYRGKDVRRGFYSRETELMANGKEAADKVFTQDTERTVSSKTREFYTRYKTTASVIIASQGYVTEKMLIEAITGYKDWEKVELSGKCLPGLLQDLSLQRIRLNKKAAETYNVEGINYGCKIIVPAEE